LALKQARHEHRCGLLASHFVKVILYRCDDDQTRIGNVDAVDVIVLLNFFGNSSFTAYCF
jgi:hypothetical protein